jgi:hypothetical protein
MGGVAVGATSQKIMAFVHIFRYFNFNFIKIKLPTILAKRQIFKASGI